jgi:hypothetical protein
MRPIVLYRDVADWRQESESVKRYFPIISSRMQIKSGDLVIPRFSALPFFKELEQDAKEVGAQLINSYDQHRYIADLGNWYQDLKEFTPRTWDSTVYLPDNMSFILKGETNSKKFLWNTHCFAKDRQAAIEVEGRLLQDSLLQDQKIYVREYVELERLADGFQGLPISREYRFFIYKRKILSGGFYWSSHVEQIKDNISSDEVPREFLNEVIDKIQNTELSDPPVYYVIDVAKKAKGDWIVVELNDGTMSGLSENNAEVLYSNLQKELMSDEG